MVGMVTVEDAPAPSQYADQARPENGKQNHTLRVLSQPVNSHGIFSISGAALSGSIYLINSTLAKYALEHQAMDARWRFMEPTLDVERTSLKAESITSR